MPPPHCRALSLLLLWPLAGCMSMSGLGGTSEYACQAPEGVACDSVSGTYANAVHHNLPSQRGARREPGTERGVGAAVSAGVATVAAPPLSTSLRSAPRILRLWYAPWEDADHDLYDQGYVYVQIDSGQWLIDHAQRAVRDQYAPVRPPAASAQPPAADAPAQETPPFPLIDLPTGDPR
nr:TraV family lipoprotein [Xanthomonas hortorum]